MNRASLIFEQIAIGGRQNLAYLVGDSQAGEMAAVDAGFKPELIVNRVNELGVHLKYVLDTHSDRDHVGAEPKIKRFTGRLS